MRRAPYQKLRTLDAVTGTGTAVQVTATSTPCDEVLLVAHEDNADPIYVGDSTVTAANGIPVRPGGSFALPVANATMVYVIASSGDEARALAGIA